MDNEVVEISKKVLEKKYRSMTNNALAAELGVDPSTLINLIKKSGIKMKGQGKQGKKIKIVG